ncbi:MAG: hypothetical protein ACXW3F_08575 [Pyrinomonadaceae bacterium]
MFETDTELEPDPVIEFYKKDIDRTLIRENLRLTVEQRFDKLMALQRVAEELCYIGREDLVIGLTDAALRAIDWQPASAHHPQPARRR